MDGKRLARGARRVVGRIAHEVKEQVHPTPPPPSPTELYLKGGRVPWSEGYGRYRREVTVRALNDADMMRRFRDGESLPDGYGAKLDERVVEYPWVLSRLPDGPGTLLDGGSTLSYPFTLELPSVAVKKLVVVTLAPPAHMAHAANVSYLFDDLRNLMLRDAVFDTVVCISTLEHIGLDNTQLYSEDARFAEHNLSGYEPALDELRRVLKPGGTLLLTVPFGKAEDHGWLQQFDRDGIGRIVGRFGGRLASETYFAHGSAGWQVASADACSDARYFDVHASKEPAPDGAAAARAVCCLELIKS